MKKTLLLLLIFSCLQINAQIPTDGLVAYYPFNGNANDTSGNGSSGTVTAATLTSDRFGNSNAAYNFDGVNSYIDAAIPNIPKNNAARTISGWFKTNDAFSDPNKYDASIFNYGSLAKLQRLSLSVYSKGYLQMISGASFSSDDFYINNFDYANNDWYFFTVTYDGTKLSIYVNGKYVDQKAVSLNTIGNIFRIGQRISGDTVKEGFKGTIDDIAIWNRVLTPEEILALYVPGNTTNYTLIPDANFEKKLIDLGIDSGTVDGKVLTSNISTVKLLDLTKSNISDLTGIQDFVSLTDLYCGQNSLTTVNVSKNIALTTLDCNNNKITSLDVSNNIALLNLSCYSNQLTVLDVSKNTALTKLDSGSNKYTALDVSSNTALTFLGCNTSQLTSLDVSRNTALKLLDCRENKLTQLDVSKITTLTELYCQSNQLTNLNISKNKALEFLNCSKNQLTTLDVSVNTALVGLYSNSNQLTSLNLKNANNVKFAYLNLTNNLNLTCIQVDDLAYANTNWSAKKDATASYNEICTSPYTLIPDINFENKLISEGLDSGIADGKVLTSNIASVTDLELYNSSISDLTGIEAFSALEVLNCGKNQITSLDFSQNTKLKQLECYENKLMSLNLTANPDLWYLDCFTNKLTTLDLSQNKLLQTVYCFENLLTNLNISNLTNLESLDCPDNQLTNLDVSTNTALKELHCYRNKLQSLDVSKNVALYDLVCYSNELTYLNLKNGNNTNFVVEQHKTIFTNNPNLTCIQVDDVAYSNANWADRKDVTANYSSDCSSSFVAIPDQNFEQKLIDLGIDTDGLNGKITAANISGITVLDLSNSNISNLSGIENFTSLTYLDVSNNQLKTLDVSNNGLLEILNASSNQLTTLDLSKNTKLTIVYVANNPLVSLNLRNGNNRNFILPTQTGKNAATGLYTSFLGLTTLSCIQVDDADYSNANWSNIKESTTTYSNTCKTLGIEDSVFARATIYPNPTNGEVNILNITLEQANVYNELGQLVKTFTLNSNNTNNTINLSGLPKGVYYIYLINHDAASAKKVIVE
ncbi:LamG-like jellyroll fold domain-containing protein [Flavobacterium sp. MMLR14_040]|uniref:LamG-like jellyroll fold domain-containing protein n=1 Tax=Flavobacterium sp. MMLR14_040 TaxID=3093843 RepID=UPI0029906BEF|nr:LamG-like jellyroll fold domain-containing protein [Flavobacterium sp. MMLR14_040]MDW8849691.1 LamG-like jellyroll fold domain-containing protein [Flavobacterium sp. MMLR14_040]